MTSRERILAAVKAHRPAAVPHPAALETAPALPRSELVDRFTAAIRTAAGTCTVVRRTDLARSIAERVASYPTVASTLDEPVGASLVPSPATVSAVLAAVDVMVCPGTIGVAESGAVWVTEAQMGHRAAPFLAEHLVLVVPVDGLVVDLEEAYRRLRIEEEAFGVWIAGPSKTADIEQSLVIGAHGPRSLLVLLVED